MRPAGECVEHSDFYRLRAGIINAEVAVRRCVSDSTVPRLLVTRESQ